MTSTTPGIRRASLASSPLSDRRQKQDVEIYTDSGSETVGWEKTGVSTLQLSRDLSVRSRAGNQSEGELPVRSGDVVAVHSFTRGLADGGAMHDGTPHGVQVALELWHMLRREKRKQSASFHNLSLPRKYGDTLFFGTWNSCRLGWISLGKGRIFSGSSSVITFCKEKATKQTLLFSLISCCI